MSKFNYKVFQALLKTNKNTAEDILNKYARPEFLRECVASGFNENKNLTRFFNDENYMSNISLEAHKMYRYLQELKKIQLTSTNGDIIKDQELISFTEKNFPLCAQSILLGNRTNLNSLQAASNISKITMDKNIYSSFLKEFEILCIANDAYKYSVLQKFCFNNDDFLGKVFFEVQSNYEFFSDETNDVFSIFSFRIELLANTVYLDNIANESEYFISNINKPSNFRFKKIFSTALLNNINSNQLQKILATVKKIGIKPMTLSFLMPFLCKDTLSLERKNSEIIKFIPTNKEFYDEFKDIVCDSTDLMALHEVINICKLELGIENDTDLFLIPESRFLITMFKTANERFETLQSYWDKMSVISKNSFCYQFTHDVYSNLRQSLKMKLNLSYERQEIKTNFGAELISNFCKLIIKDKDVSLSGLNLENFILNEEHEDFKGNPWNYNFILLLTNIKDRKPTMSETCQQYIKTYLFEERSKLILKSMVSMPKKECLAILEEIKQVIHIGLDSMISLKRSREELLFFYLVDTYLHSNDLQSKKQILSTLEQTYEIELTNVIEEQNCYIDNLIQPAIGE